MVVMGLFCPSPAVVLAQETNQNQAKLPTVAEENLVIGACLDQYGNKPWKDRPYVDYLVTMDFVTWTVDVAPKTQVAEDMFRACVKEAMQTGKIRYRPGMVGRALRHSAKSLEQTPSYTPKLTARDVIRAMQLESQPCVVEFLQHPFAGAILVSAKVENGKATQTALSASTFPKEFNQCMVELMANKQFPVLKHKVEVNAVMVMQSSRR